ncbi:hypothetical protein [Methylobacter sp.]|uniref:hypothetical protein n=1 Tax=Methylobacter sp. TaxID=2051955 RepID=UPI0011F43B46|nr:hypothetical protein [Methylobacter sp.]TAK59489.1 MAG: hypothetical protein EPO18_20215 [Methylobacter sp.]
MSTSSAEPEELVIVSRIMLPVVHWMISVEIWTRLILIKGLLKVGAVVLPIEVLRWTRWLSGPIPLYRKRIDIAICSLPPEKRILLD